ncbi:hypothetical protein [Salinicola acroporae]|uniref:Uncharacterized protein n=1 Tax=Salinicola acroporae TaxID=1541440 RepID=A0ABT6I5Y7_9GAMM|nr:hypothetical protein [Salinicola acroporae]MDH4572908.1 hypothetical protein [Salinicola acroporae]
MNIVTFGSCLSRYTANQFAKLFGGKVLSSVYHNRSDVFYKRFVSRELSFEGLDKLMAAVLPAGSDDSGVDNNARRILENQSPDKIGLHRLSRGKPLLEALQDQPDLILFDNYMDLSAKLVSEKNLIEDRPFFLKLNGLGSVQGDYVLGDYLPPEDGVYFMSRIISHFSTISPNSKMVFINFPYNTYAGDESRMIRTKTYQAKFRHGAVHVVPCQTIRKPMQTKDKQHFQQLQYAAYAGMVSRAIR